MKEYKKMKHIVRGILIGIGALLFAALLALLFGWVLMLLWNWLMPEIFGLAMIGYWQAWGLILLSHLLFKGGGHHGPQGGRQRFHHFHNRHGHGPYGQGRGAGKGPGNENEDFDEFKREFRNRMRARWHDGDQRDCCHHDSEEHKPSDDVE